jgi:hypothetical protein
MLLNEYGDDFVSIQYHTSGSYWISWCSTRMSFYGVSGTPTTWFDGVLECEGAYTNDVQMYNWYRSQIETRLAVPTKVAIELYGEETADQTYEITAAVTSSASGDPIDAVLHLVQVLDYYPYASDNRYRNCVRQHLGDTSLVLPQGETATVTDTLVLSGVDWTNRADVTIVAFLQEPGGSAGRTVHQAATMDWPFTPQFVEGDVDLDGDVDLSDLSALLAVYGLCEGDAGYDDAADIVDDQCIDLADLSALLANYGYGT